jgi:hypothetical protein
MRKILTWSYSALAAITGGLAVIVTQSPAAENNSGGLELIRAEILLDRLADGRDSEVADAARILLEHWRARRYLAEFNAPIRIDPQAEKKDDDRLEGEMKSVAEVGAARTTAVGQPQYQTDVSKCLGDYDMCVKEAHPRFICITFSTMCIATTFIPFVEGSK